jgi:hypothetical protein
MFAGSDSFLHVGRATVGSLSIEVDRVLGFRKRAVEIGIGRGMIVSDELSFTPPC